MEIRQLESRSLECGEVTSIWCLISGPVEVVMTIKSPSGRKLTIMNSHTTLSGEAIKEFMRQELEYVRTRIPKE